MADKNDITNFEADLRYELWMLFGSTRLAILFKRSGYGDIEKYFNDSVYTHARNLYNFLNTNRNKLPSKHDLNICRLLKGVDFALPDSKYYSEWEESLNRHVSHIAPGRLNPTNRNSSGDLLNTKIEFFAKDIETLWCKCLDCIDDAEIRDMLSRTLSDTLLLAENDYDRAVTLLGNKK